MDIFVANPVAENVVPGQQAPEEKVDKEIEMEKLVSSPVKTIQAGPSGPT